jgi:hypothetical protein
MLPRLLALTLCLLVFGPPAANAGWSDPFDVSSPGSIRREARVAVAPSGAAVVAWLARDGATAVLQARRIEPDGTRGPILDLSAAGRIPATPDVAIDADGHATVVWSDRADSGVEEIVRARRITAAGALEPAIDLTGPGLTSKLPNVEVAPSGAATVIWLRRPTWTVHLRRIDPTGGPGATLDLAPPDSGQFDLAVEADGDAYVTWATFDGADQLIHGRRVDAGGNLGDVDTLSDDEQLAFNPRVALDGAGTPTVAWLCEDDSIELRRGMGDIAHVGTGDTLGDLAVDAAGNATVVWIGPSGSSRATYLRRLPATGAPGPINDLWSGGDDHGPRLTLDGGGTPTLIWGNATSTLSTIRARTAPAGAPFGPIADLWPATTDAYASDPEIASNAAGAITAVWRRGDAAEEAIVAARFTHPAPTLSSLAPPPVPAPPAPSCEAVTVGKLRTAKSRRVAAVLKVDRPARLDLLSAELAYRRGGKRRTARLRVNDLTVEDRATLRFAPPARVRPGQRVKLALRLRARSTVAGCAYGAVTTRRLTTRVPS